MFWMNFLPSSSLSFLLFEGMCRTLETKKLFVNMCTCSATCSYAYLNMSLIFRQFSYIFVFVFQRLYLFL
ncbi:hypothetical protein L6452_36319 [Arctium lappa]|uniref:Uncharacterized protein n=1 Tax=Arctium lappa TaxID=4217 RepID=A0ACB8Y9J9_ARCLA|nr:hypothetical protein L6452_36319 [Arctium lappa]